MKFTFQSTYKVVKTNRLIRESQPDLETSEVATESKKIMDRANSGEVQIQNLVVIPSPVAAATAERPPLVVPPIPKRR